MSSDDLLSAEIDDGEVLDKDYDEEEDKEAPKEKIISLGYGKAETSSKNLVITAQNAFVPNAYTYLDELGKKVSAGYFSYSALSCYRRCQKYFFFKYVQRLRNKSAAPKMWGGSGMHDVVEIMLTAKLDDKKFSEAIRDTVVHSIAKNAGGDADKFTLESIKPLYPGKLPFTNESAKKAFKESYASFAADYDQANARSINEGAGPLPDVNWGARIASEDEFLVKYLNAVDSYVATEYPLVKPITVEELIIYHLPLHSGGTVPIVGFIDLVEETDFMSEYYNKVYRAKDEVMDPVTKEFAKKTIKSVDNGELMITDHKCGLAKTYESARVDQQLTLYSLAKDIPVVGFDSIALGTTGGKRPDRAKPAIINKVFARRTPDNYSDLIDDFNAIIKGISAGIFDKSGAANSMVCSPTLCEYYHTQCFVGGCKK